MSWRCACGRARTWNETVALAGAFNKVSRVMRLTLALDAELERDAARDAATEARAALEDQRLPPPTLPAPLSPPILPGRLRVACAA